MTDYTQLEDAEAERAIFARMRNIDKSERLNYAAKGIMGREVKTRSLWKERIDPETGLHCRSFASWLRACCPYGYSGAYAAIEDVEALHDVPDADLADIPPSNFQTMRQLSSAVRAETEVLAAAKSQRNDEFVKTIRKAHPDQHLSPPSRLRLTFTEEQRAEIDEAVALAIRRGDAPSKEQAIFMWAINYKQECEEQMMMSANNGQVAHA